MKLLKVVFFVMLLCFISIQPVQADSAIYYDATDTIRLYYNTSATLPWVEEQINNASLITHDGSTYYINATLDLYDSALYINNTTVSKIVLADNVKLNWGQAFYLHGLEITGGNEIGAIEFYNIYMHDAGGLRFDYLDSDVYNVTLNNTSTGLKFLNYNNHKIYDITTNDTDTTAIACHNCTGTEISNVNVKDAGNYSNPSTGCYAILFAGKEDMSGGSYNCTAHDIFVNGTGWSSIEATDDGTHNITFYNITVYNTGHNGLDLHGGYNHTVQNMTVYGSSTPTANNYLLTYVHDVYLYNIYSYDSPGSGIQAGTASNITIENYYSDGDVDPLKILDLVNTNITNITSDTADYGLFLTELLGVTNINTTIVDAHLKNITVSELKIASCDNAKIVNANTSRVMYDPSGTAGYDVTYYYYPDITVVNTLGQPVKNAVITVNTTSVNGFGINQTHFITDENGKLYDDGNRSNWLAIPEHYSDGTNSINYISEITATKSGQTNTTVVNPDNTWYSANLLSPSSPETVLLLDVPVLDANFTASPVSGVATMFVQFTDTSTGSPTSWLWNFGDGTTSTVQNPVHTYSDAGNYTVNLTVTNVDGSDTESKTDYITVTSESFAPVAAFTANDTSGTAPFDVAFTDNSTNTPTAWSWNFGDGATSTDQSPVHTYSADGSYTVTLTASNAAGSHTLIKSSYITVGTTSSTSLNYVMWWLRTHFAWWALEFPLIGEV